MLSVDGKSAMEEKNEQRRRSSSIVAYLSSPFPVTLTAGPVLELFFRQKSSAIAVSSRAGSIPKSKPPQNPTPPRLFLPSRQHPPPRDTTSESSGAGDRRGILLRPLLLLPPSHPRAPGPRGGGSDYKPQHRHWVARRLRFLTLSVADASDMLPGLSSPPSLVPSVSPAATPSSSIGASIAIVAVVIIGTVLLTCCIAVLCRRRPMSCSSFARRSSISPKASSSAEFEMNAVMSVSGLKVPVPSAPCLPEVERVILELLSQPPVLVQPGSSMFCCICGQDLVPTDMILALPVCSHKFHELCIISRLRMPAAPSCCPFCDAPITTPCADKTNLAPAYCSDQYDIESQMMTVPAPPGEEVAEAVGGSRGWLRSSLDRLSGSWRGCSSNHATAVVVPVSSQHTTRSWIEDNMGHLAIDSNGIQMQSGEEIEAVGGSHGWLWSYLATLSSTWSGRYDSCSTTVVLPVSSRRATGSWDPEAAEQRN